MGFSKARLKELEALETKDTKYCAGCRKIKSLYEFAFSKHARKFASTYCLNCKSEKSKENRIFRTFGLSLREYDVMLAKQNGRCKICGNTKMVKNQGRFHIDHDHKTHKIRGILCQQCNALLGFAKDDIKILASAIQYLIDSRKQ